MQAVTDGLQEECSECFPAARDCSAIAFLKQKQRTAVDLCVTVNFPPPCSCSWFEGFNPCSEGDNPRVLCRAHYLPKVLTAGFWPGESHEEHKYLGLYFFRNTGTEGTCPGTRVPAFGCGNDQKKMVMIFCSIFPVISPCLSTAGHELTKMCMRRACSVSVHLRKGLDLCALKIWWIKETWKCVLIVKSCLPEMQTDKCSRPKGLSCSFSRDAQNNRVGERHLGLFAKDLPPECLCTYCHLMKVISLFFVTGSHSHQMLWSHHSWRKR